MVNFASQAHTVGVPDEVREALPPDLTTTLDALSAQLGTTHDPTSKWTSDPSPILVADKETASQSWWADQVGKRRLDDLERQGTARDQIRLVSQQGVLATAWLTTIPSRALNTLLPDRDFRSLCRFWLGLPLFQDGSTPECPACREACDPFGDHFVTCNKNGWTRRHNAVRDELSRVLTIEGIPHDKEVPAKQRTRPADILLLSWDKGVDTCIDITISHPLQADCHPLSLDHAKRHLSAAEQRKLTKHHESCTLMHWSSHPAAFNPWGGTGPAARSLLTDILRRATSDLDEKSRNLRITEIRQGLSMALAREVAKQLALRTRIVESQ